MPKRSPPHPQMSSLRAKVRQLIAQKGYTSVEKFAHEHGIEQSVVSKFLSGNHDVLLSTALRIFSALGCDILGNGFAVAEPQQKWAPAKRRPTIKVVLTDVAAVTILRHADDQEPLIIQGKKKPAP